MKTHQALPVFSVAYCKGKWSFPAVHIQTQPLADCRPARALTPYSEQRLGTIVARWTLLSEPSSSDASLAWRGR